jgi:hypothetical protein
MATRISFDSGQSTTVIESEDQVVEAVRRDHPNPVKLESMDGLVLYLNWTHVTTIGPILDPVPIG